MREAAPEGAKITGKAQEGVKQLKNAYDDAYTNAWSKANNISTEGRVNFVNAVEKTVAYLPKNERNKVLDIAKDFKGVLSDLSPKSIKAYDNRLRRAIDSAPYDNRELREGLKLMRGSIRSGLPKEATEALTKVDKDYAKYLVVKKATSKAAENKGEFSPSQLVSSSRTVGGESRTALGEAPLQELATAGAQTAGKKLGGQPLDFFRRLSAAVPSPVPVQAISNATIGQNPMQRLARNSVDSETIKALRKISPTGGQLGVLLDDEREIF